MTVGAVDAARWRWGNGVCGADDAEQDGGDTAAAFRRRCTKQVKSGKSAGSPQKVRRKSAGTFLSAVT